MKLIYIYIYLKILKWLNLKIHRKYRQDILLQLNYDLKEELQKMEETTLETMKCYQIW